MPHRGPYVEYERLVDPARRTAQIWRLVGGVVTIFAVYLTLTQAAFYGIEYALPAAEHNAFLFDLSTGATPAAMYALLLSFGFLTVGVTITAVLWHRRSIQSVLGNYRRFWAQFWRVFGALAVLNCVFVVGLPWDASFVPNVPLAKWLVLLPFSVIAVLVQVSAEEVVFRGYLQQQLAARFRTPLVWAMLPSALFGLGHYMPAEAGENAVLIALWAVAFGVLLADITARAGSLGPAIALHLANNITAILIVSQPDQLSGLSLYLTPFSMADPGAMRMWLPVDFAAMIVSWLVARIMIRR